MKFIKLFKKGIKILIENGPSVFVSKLKNKFEGRNFNKLVNRQYQIWFQKNYPSRDILKDQKQKQSKFKSRPLISIITPVYNTPEKFLRECIESVIDQSYGNWELCLVDDASKDEKVRQTMLQYAAKDKRIKYKFRKTNGHISESSNNALNLATGDLIAFLDHDDILWPNALFEVVKLINEKPKTQFIYSDEDKFDISGNIHSDPFFKPGWSPEYLRSINYITHFTVIKKSLIENIGGFKKGTEGAQDWDLFLRASRELEKNGNCHPLNPENPIQHIPAILYSWRKSSTSTAQNAESKKYAYEAQKKVLEFDILQRKTKAEVTASKYSGLWNINYAIKGNPLVSIIIPTKDAYAYISKCLESVISKSTYKNYELIIVDTGSTDPRVINLYKSLSSMKKYSHNNVAMKQFNNESSFQSPITNHSKLSPITYNLSPRISILNWNKPFNFSSVCNYGSNKSKGEYLLFLNNDTEIISPDWIENILGFAQQKDIGAVGCKLIYPNNTIQHGGIIIMSENEKIQKGIAFHAFKLLKDDTDYQIYNSSIYGARNYSAVTAACLMISKKKYFEVNGQDEKFQIAFNDVDFCLKLLKKGYRNVYLGNTNVFHHESISVGQPGTVNRNQELFEKEKQYFIKKWSPLFPIPYNLYPNSDPYYNPNLSFDLGGFTIRA